MKRIFSFAAMMLACILCFCQTATSANPTRTVLFTCGTEDEFFCNEYYSNMNVMGNQFACITKNKNTGKLTLILNGNPVATAKDLWVYWIDLTSKDKCIYTYAEAEKEKYIIIEGQKYGPYENTVYCQYACDNYSNGTPNLDLLYKKHSFKFERMGNYYRHDNDGSIYKLSGTNLWNATEENPQYTTKDGLHTASFSDNYRLLTVDGNNYVLPIDADAKEVDLRDFYLTDTGDCIIDIYLRHDDWNWNFLHLYINKDKQAIENIQDNEYFDPSSRSIKPITSIQSSIRRQVQMEPSNLNFSLQDKTKRHLFTANWDYEYVMIDDKKFGNHTPINAFYDSDNNAFGWVTIENRQLVLYSYEL